MNKKLHPHLFVFDRARTAEGFLFATHNDRARYLGQWSWEKPNWLKQNEGRYRRIEDVLRDGAPETPSVEAEINPIPDRRSRSIHPHPLRFETAAMIKTTSPRPMLCSKTALARAVDVATDIGERNAEEQKPPAGIAKSTPKLSPEIMRIVLNSLRKCPIRYLAALAAGIHPKTLAYWIRRSEAGDDGYDIRWQGITQRFHEHCESAIDEAHQQLEDEWLRRAIDGYEKVLTHRGRVVYKIDQELAARGFQGPDAYLRDENGKPVPETIHKEDTKAQLHVLKRHRPDTWAKRPKIDAPREGGVLVIADVTKKPKYNTAKSVRARSWKADLRRLREAKRNFSPASMDWSKRTFSAVGRTSIRWKSDLILLNPLNQTSSIRAAGVNFATSPSP